MRKTKIIATLGPASSTEETLSLMIDSHVDVLRFNMKHNTPAWHSELMALVEKICHEKKKRVGILLDLQGPEVRVGHMKHTSIDVESGKTVRFGRTQDGEIPVDHPEVFAQLTEGQIMYADDGKLEFRIVKTTQDYMDVEVIEGGMLQERKTLNFPGATLDFPTLVDRDLESLSVAARHHVDFIALSFVRKVDDIMTLKKEMQKNSVEAKIIAKIEHPDAVKNFDAILSESDGIMVARGDLGIEYPLEEVPHLQKLMVKKCRTKGRPVIIATEMLESMVHQTRPTRAEVSDVANAVYDSADAIMLSAESASGDYPVKAVQTMNRIATHVDNVAEFADIEVDWKDGGQSAAVVGAAHQLMRNSFEGANDIEAIIILTETGETVQFLSRLRPQLPIIALSENEKTLDQLKLSWGVTPVYHNYSKDKKLHVHDLVSSLASEGILTKGKKVIMIYGEVLGKPGLTSVVRVQQVA